MRTHRRVGVTVLLLLIAAVTVIAMSPVHTFDSAVQSASISSPGTSAMRVYLDPETGEVSSVPTADATFAIGGELENALRHDTEGLTQTAHANGMVSINLDGRYQDVMVVRIGPNGKQEFCTTDAKTLAKGMTDTTTPTGLEVK